MSMEDDKARKVFNLSDDQYEKISRIATEKGLSPSVVLGRAIEFNSYIYGEVKAGSSIYIRHPNNKYDEVILT